MTRRKMKKEHDEVREERRCGRGGECRGGGAAPRRLEGTDAADVEEGCRFGFCGGEIGTWLHCGGTRLAKSVLLKL